MSPVFHIQLFELPLLSFLPTFQIHSVLLSVPLARRLRLVTLLWLAPSMLTLPLGTKQQGARERKQSNEDSLYAPGILSSSGQRKGFSIKLLMSLPLLPNCLGVGQERTERENKIKGSPLPSLTFRGSLSCFLDQNGGLRLELFLSASGAWFWVWVAFESGQEIPEEGKRETPCWFYSILSFDF